VEFEFKCVSCGQVHRGMPTFGVNAPLSHYNVPDQEREKRCSLGTDDCVIEEKWLGLESFMPLPVLHSRVEGSKCSSPRG